MANWSVPNEPAVPSTSPWDPFKPKVYVYRRSTLDYASQTLTPVVDIELPTRASGEAVGYDLRALIPRSQDANNYIELKPLVPTIVSTGLFVAIPKSSVMMVCSRSGLAAKGILVVNAPGIIDPDYRGEVKVILMYLAPPDAPSFVIKNGDRIAQAVFTHVNLPEIVSVAALADLPIADSDRGAGGFGSTGR